MLVVGFGASGVPAWGLEVWVEGLGLGLWVKNLGVGVKWFEFGL